jgi:hypothetical protein
VPQGGEGETGSAAAPAWLVSGTNRHRQLGFRAASAVPYTATRQLLVRFSCPSLSSNHHPCSNRLVHPFDCKTDSCSCSTPGSPNMLQHPTCWIETCLPCFPTCRFLGVWR